MSVNYQAAQAAEAAADQKVQRNEVNARGWQQVLAKYPLRDTQANYQLLLQWSNPITLEAFETLLRQKPAGFNLDMSSREGIIEDIVAHSHGDANTLRQLKARLTTYSLAQLRQKRHDIEFKSQVHTKFDAEKFVASQRNTEVGWRNTGYPKLGSTYVPPGQVQAVPTGQYLRDLAKNDFWLFKRMVKLYSADQCTYWMQQA
jgi:hypothetical protein